MTRKIAPFILALFLLCLGAGQAQACGYEMIHSRGVVQVFEGQKYFLSDHDELVPLVDQRAIRKAIFVPQLEKLKHGDQVRLGDTSFVYLIALIPVEATADTHWF